MEKTKELATELANQLSQAGHTVYFAGGCVRDFLLKKPIQDYDIATSALPTEVIKIFPKAKLIGQHFGVVNVSIDKLNFEIATFRTDHSYSDHRHPDAISFSTPQEDALRRDFTINGLFQNPFSGELIDYIGGKNDLENKLIRAIGDPLERFEEDALRLLRAIRFATTLNFKIHPTTWMAIQQKAQNLKSISTERIRTEFSKIIMHPNRARGLQLLLDSNLLPFILPEVLALINCKQPPKFHPEGDVYVHTKLVLSLLSQQASLELCLSALLHDIGKPATQSIDDNQTIRFHKHDSFGANMSRDILSRLYYPNRVIDAVVAMVENHMNFSQVKSMRVATLKRFISRPTFEQELDLHRADCLASHGKLDNYTFLQQSQCRFKEEAQAQSLILPPLITGNHLIKLQLQPSPLFQKILKAVETEQLENRLKTENEAIKFVKDHFCP